MPYPMYDAATQAVTGNASLLPIYVKGGRTVSLEGACTAKLERAEVLNVETPASSLFTPCKTPADAAVSMTGPCNFQIFDASGGYYRLVITGFVADFNVRWGQGNAGLVG